jgi:hypothetical protein
LFLVCSIVIVMILNSNFQMGLIKASILSTNNKIIIFSLYTFIFLLGSIILLNLTHRTVYQKNTDRNTQLFYRVAILMIYFALSMALIISIFQMYLTNSYSNLVFYFTTYLSFTSSFFFLSVLCLKFFKLFLAQRNYLLILYGILFAICCCGVVMAMIYLVNGLETHPSIIKPVSPRVLIANTYSINIIFQSYISVIYDILFLISFILAWFVSVIILKPYSRRIGRYLFWFLVSIPLFFYMTRYETILNLSDQHVFVSVTNIIPSSFMESIFITFKNADIQLGGVFFGLPFLIIALKLNNELLRRTMINTVIGMMILFASRDLHTIFVSSFPPGGIVTISFTPIGSYMLLFGLISFVKLAVKDRQLYLGLIRQFDTNSILKNLIASEKMVSTLGIAKPLIDFSIQWQKENLHEEMKLDEIKEIVNDVISELRKKKYSTTNDNR